MYASTTHWTLVTPVWKSRPMAGSAMPTTVASRAAMPEPSTVAATTHRPRALFIRRPASAWGCWGLSHGGTHHAPFGIIKI